MADIDADMIANAIPAAGPEGLKLVLENLLAQTQTGGHSPKEFVILYQLEQQKSVIKVDFNHKPCHFLYQDLLGRPITKAVKNVIAEFLWSKCGERERYTREHS